MANRIQLRRGTSTEWIQFNPVLAEAEFGVEIDTGRFKIGDGATPWQTLKYERPLESVDATPSTLVLRDSNSSIKVRNINLSTGGKLFGTATTADRLTTSRLIGAASNSDLTGSASFDGSSNLDINFLLKTVFTGDTGQSYTKVTLDSKGRVTSAENPTTLSGYGILDAQPLNGILSSISTIGTGIGFLTKVDTNPASANNTIVRSLSVSSGQLTISNASGTTGNPLLGLANTTVTAGTYNSESLTSESGSSTVNTVKFDVDQYGRLTSVTAIPIATASETQKGLASFNSEDFDVSASGVVTIASQGVDNDQLQNPKIILGTTDYVLGTTYTGFTTISDLTVDTDTLHVDKVNRRVGIGTTNPTAKLDISGTGRITGLLTSTITGSRPIWSSFGVASTAESGTAPFAVSSTRKVSNLNVDFLDDLTSLDFLRRTDDFNNANNEGNQYIASNFWIDATTVTILDPIIDVGGIAKGAAPTSNDNKDRGLTLQYFSGSAKRAFVGWDNSSGGFALARDVTVSGEIIQGSSVYANLDVGATTLRNGSFTIKTGGTGAGTLAATGETTTFTVAHTTGNTSISGTLDVTGNVAINTNKFNVTASSGNTSIAGTLTVTDDVTLNKNVTIAGSSTASTEFFRITDGTTTRFQVDSANGNTSVSGILDLTSNFNINTNKFNVVASSGNTTVAGTLGVTGATTLSSTLDVTGNVFVNTNKFMITASSGNTTIAGTLGVSGNTTLSSDLGVTGNTTLTGNLTANSNSTLGDASTDTLTVNATSTFNAPVTISGTNTLSVGGNITVTGDLTVNGTTTTINSTTLTVDDKNIELGSIASPTNLTADGGGITLRGTTDKTINWINSNAAWTSSENFDLASGKEYRINNTAVIDSSRNILNIVNHTMSGNITVNTDRFVVTGSSGNTSIAGTLSVTGNTTLSSVLNLTGNFNINTNKFNVVAATGNTSIAGTLSVTDDVTLNKNVTIAGSSVASTELFRITDGTTTRFQVDSANGNTTISGTLGVTGATTLSSTLSVTDNVTLNRNVTIVGSDTAATELFKIQNGSSLDRFTVDTSSGNTSISGTLGVTGATTLSSTLGVTGVTTISNATDATALGTGALVLSAGGASINNQLRVGGNTNLGGTLGVTGATTLSSTLSVTNDVTLNRNVTIVGSDTAATEFFKIQNASAVDRFVVDSSSGNTTISGTLGVTGNTTLSGTLGVTNLATFNNGVLVSGSTSPSTEFFRINDGSAVKFEVDSATGNTTIAGTLGVTGATTLSSTLGVTGNFAVATNKFTVNATSGNTLVAGTLDVTNDFAIATNRFNVASATGNTTIAGTLGVTGLTTLNNGLTIAGSTTAATEFFRITDGAGTPVTRFLVDTSSGNTTISGTLGVTGATTLSSTLGVTGDTTLTGLLNANGGIAVDTNAFTVAGDGTGNTSIAGTLAVTGNTTLTGDLAVNGADITTTATGTATLFNTNATTLNIGGAATVVSIGAASGTTTINNANTVVTGDLAVNGGDLTSSSATFNLLNSLTTLNIGTSTGTISIGSVSSTTTFNNNVTVSGNLTVNGTTTTINSTTISVDDKNIELGSVATPTDTTADGGGITLLGATNKTFNWVNADSGRWTSSENLVLANGKSFGILNAGGTLQTVLSATTLGSTVVNSSLTSVGTLTGLTVSGNTNINNISIASGTSTITTTSTNDLVLTPGGKTTTTKGFDVSGTTNLTGNTNIANISIATGTSTITTTSTNNLVLTPGGKTTTTKDFDISGVTTLTGNTNINNISVAAGTSTITTTSTNNLVLTPGGKTTTTKDLDVTATLNVVGQFNADNLRIDGNQLSSTTGAIDIKATANNAITIGSITSGNTIRYDPTIVFNVGPGSNASDAQLTIFDNIAARQNMVIDGNVTIKGSLTTSGAGGSNVSFVTYQSTAGITAITTSFTSNGTGTIYNLDLAATDNGGTITNALGVKYLVLVTRNSDSQRLMFEMMAFWDDAYGSGEIHTSEYAISNPNALPYTFDVAWVTGTGQIGSRPTLRITNVPNNEQVTVKISKTYLL